MLPIPLKFLQGKLIIPLHPTMLSGTVSVQAQEGGGWNNEPVLAVSGLSSSDRSNMIGAG